MRDPLDRPNILLVNCDDLGWGDLTCYGSALHDTPHLDRLAAAGSRFLSFYQGSPLCSPSRGGMLTGCYPRRIGFDRFPRIDGRRGWVLFPGDPVGLAHGERTIAGVLRGQGYVTRLIGKWHCGDQPEFLPTRHGFDGYFGLPYSNDMGRQVRREDSPPLPLLRDETVVEEQPDQASLTERYVEDAVAFLRAHRGDPWFLCLAHLHVHLPLYAPERFLRESRNGRYGATVACIDWAMGVLMYWLRRLDLERNTLVLFTSDNGSRCDFGPSNGPLRGTKAHTWEGGLRVPLIARWPGVVPAGRTETGLLAAPDLLPTLAALAGATLPDDRALDGGDAGDLLRGTGPSPREEFLYYNGGHLDAVRDSRWKLFVGHTHFNHHAGPVCELHDLINDPGETTDLAARQPETVRSMLARIEAARERLGDEAVGADGRDRRPIGRVADPRPLTVFDADRPYLIPLYDLDQMG